MIVVIQCAAKKRSDAGSLYTADGKRVIFVAQPDQAQKSDSALYARPDDFSDTGKTWRERIFSMNCDPTHHPHGLLPAMDLYNNAIYGALAKKLGQEHLFILSAGWGLVPSGFLLPAYDITFNKQADGYKRRRPRDHYADFRLLPADAEGPILFFGGISYLSLFASLTSGCAAERIVFHSAAAVPVLPGCRPVRYRTTTRTNWQYQCARNFVEDRLSWT